MSLESAYFAVKELVETFKANESRYLSKDYQEAEARKDFIDKFFIAFGWDVNHDTQKNPYEQEVKVEKGMFIGKGKKRADYSFALAPNYRDSKFIAEAKKPQKNLTNLDYYYQTVKYGWNTNNPVAVLTDFEEFHIIDSRSKPVISNITERKLQSFHYSDYLDKEKFAKIYYLFSRESVANGAIEKYADTLPKPRGKAVQKGLFAGSYKAVDELFLDELDTVRDTLARSFKRRNQNLNSEELTEAVQRTIDRLVFIRFLEDKLIEGEHHINGYGDKGSAWKDFVSDSKLLDTKYNGVVFKYHSIIDSKDFIPPDDADFGAVCEELSTLNSPYDFNAIPIHILGSIYERFLGKVVNATAKRVTIEEKPEVRKAGGVYYTPQYIVKYIVDNTVGKILNGSNVSPLLKVEDSPRRGVRGMDHGLTPKQISKLRFADISCGSGSFLITVFDTLLQYYGKWYQSHPEQAKKDGCIFKEGQWVLSLKQKREILINNIYGVDIDYQAVEVTQVSLFLKLLEDESLASIQQEEMFYKNKILPDLSKNIVCGNSLIGTDIYENDSPLFANEKNHPLLAKEGTKGRSSSIDERKINAMNFEDAFPEIMKNGGFDAIVGNPPYVKIQMLQESNPASVTYLKRLYFSAQSGNYDIYVTFIEKGVKLLKDSGKLGFITPHKFFNSNYGKNIREYLLNSNFIETIIHFNDIQIFTNATTYTCLLFLSNKKNKNILAYKFNKSEIPTKKLYEINFLTLETNDWKNNDWNIYDNSNKILLNKLDLFTNLEQLTTNIFQGPKAGADDVFIFKMLNLDENISIGFSKSLNEKFEIETSVVKKYLKGKNIKNYFLNFKDNEYIIYPYNKLGKLINLSDLKQYYPLAFHYFDNRVNKEILLNREKGRFEKIFWSFSRPQNMNIVFDEKIITPFNAFKNSFAYDNVKDFVFSAGVSGAYGVKLKRDVKLSYKYLIGLLNSKVTKFIIMNISTCLRGGFYSYENKYIKKLPIKNINFSNDIEVSQHNKMISLVDQMLESKKQLMSSTTEKDKTYWENRCVSLDRQIDSLVYELYGLTEEEIKIVENN